MNFRCGGGDNIRVSNVITICCQKKITVAALAKIGERGNGLPTIRTRTKHADINAQSMLILMHALPVGT